jgi:hypothetical protein
LFVLPVQPMLLAPEPSYGLEKYIHVVQAELRLLTATSTAIRISITCEPLPRVTLPILHFFSPEFNCVSFVHPPFLIPLEYTRLNKGLRNGSVYLLNEEMAYR